MLTTGKQKDFWRGEGCGMSDGWGKNEMITYIPFECHDEFEEIKCEKIRIVKKLCFFFTTTLIYDGVSDIMIRRYDRLDPRIMAHVRFLDGNEHSHSEVLVLDVFRETR